MADGPKHFRNLLRTANLSLGVWECHGDNRRPGPEQHTDLPTINVPFRGLYARHGPSGDQILDPMTVSLSNRGEVWRTSHPGPCGDRGAYVQLTPAGVERMLASPNDGGEATPFTRGYRHLDGHGWLGWRSLVADIDRDAPDALAVEDAVCGLIEQLVPAPALPAHAAELARAARAALATRSLPIPQLARDLGVSPFHLCRCFRRAAGTTIHAWDEHLRLRRAADHLRGGGRDLTTVALDHGFSSHAHFTTRFRRAFGVTPSAWRARS